MTTEHPLNTGPSASSLGHLPASERWQFDAGVTDVFDDMLARSIPEYQVMRAAVEWLGRRFQKDGTAIIDLGCSRGEALAPLVRAYGEHNRFIGLEISEPMLEAARQKFAGYIACGIVDIRKHDLRYDPYPRPSASVALGVLTLMFTPIEYRPRIIQQVYDNLLPGGAFILVEKLVGETAQTQALLSDRYLAMKAANGYSQAEIEAKRLSLEGVQVCLSASMNEAMLRAAGFKKVESFWRWFNFCGWVAIK